MSRRHRRSRRAGDVHLDTALFEAFFEDRAGEPTPPFSSDLATAWILLQRLRRERGPVEVVGMDGETWICRIHDGGDAEAGCAGVVVEEAATAPLAISRAALRVAMDGRRRRARPDRSGGSPKGGTTPGGGIARL